MPGVTDSLVEGNQTCSYNEMSAVGAAVVRGAEGRLRGPLVPSGAKSVRQGKLSIMPSRCSSGLASGFRRLMPSIL